MITGAHSIVYSTDAEADRTFLRDVLRLPHVDVGGGWLIFGLPPAEVAVHPAEENDRHELYLLCDDIEGFVARMRGRRIRCGPVQRQPWGLLTQVTLPGGGKLGVYEPRHARPRAVRPRRAGAAAPSRAAGPPRRPRTAPRSKPAHRRAKRSA